MNELDTLKDLRWFMSRLATLPGGITSEGECFSYVRAVSFLDEALKHMRAKPVPAPETPL